MNAPDLERELEWFTQRLDGRLTAYFGAPLPAGGSLAADAAPDLSSSDAPYAEFVRRHGLSTAERLAVVLALVPHVRPQLLDVFLTRNKTFDRPFTEFGCRLDAAGEVVPTGGTLAFVLGGTDLAVRFAVESMFSRDHLFAQQDVLRLVPAYADQPLLSGTLRMAPEYVGLLTSGRPYRPDSSPDFPARRIETAQAWTDVVLHPSTLSQVQEIETWLRHGDTLMGDWGMAPKLRPGYRALFYGPPGTGKTMTACLLGQSTGRDVYKVDLSLIVSKYIGETEKNLGRVFDQAQHREWLLFFDEADALFGKRSETRDAHDRYANQEVAFLLQRIEAFDGIVILATNQKDNIDRAFARRFESVIYFPVPRREERLRLWQQGFSPKAALDRGVDLELVAAEHELCGGAIMNVIRYASLQALAQGDGVVTADLLRRGVHREQAKEGRSA